MRNGPTRSLPAPERDNLQEDDRGVPCRFLCTESTQPSKESRPSVSGHDVTTVPRFVTPSV